jgi:hypothetical protein
LPAAAPEAGFEPPVPASAARASTAFAGALAAIDVYWGKVINCQLPAAITAALAAQRATPPAAGAARTGLLVELLSAGAAAEVIVPARTLAVDEGASTRAYDISMWTMIYRKEDDVLAWIAYYIALGVEHFFVYDNMSTDSTLVQLVPLVRAGLVTLVVANFTTQSQCTKGLGAGETQDLAVNHMYTRWGAFSRWVMHMDVDEYIVFPGLPAGEAWLRNQSHGSAAVHGRPLSTLPQLLAVFGQAAPASEPPPFDGLIFWSAFAAIPPVPACTRHSLDAPACERHYATNMAAYDHTYAKLMVFKAHVPIHRNMHKLSFAGARGVRVQPEAAVIHHLVGCHALALKRAAPPRHVAACGAVVNFGLADLSRRLADLGLLERMPAGAPADNDNEALWRDSSLQFRVADMRLATSLVLDTLLRTARCATASVVFRNQYMLSVSPVREAAATPPPA